MACPLDPKNASSNASAYRLLCSILQAAEEEELIDRTPPKIRGASSAPVKQVVVPTIFDEIAVTINEMPERPNLLIALAVFVGLHKEELLELPRSDIDGVAGRITVMRKVDKDVNPSVRGACPGCGRHISSRNTKSGVRTVHFPPPFLDAAEGRPRAHRRGNERSAIPGDRTTI